MGCDIHLFIEHKINDNWWCFGGEINPGRDYGIFANLCGVRNYGEIKPITDLRGFPNDASWKAVDKYTLGIDNDINCDCGSYCSKEQAEQWCKYGSKMYDENRVIDPDSHSASWANSDELEKVLDICKKYDRGIDTRWLAVLKILRHFEEAGYESRIVFWFDN